MGATALSEIADQDTACVHGSCVAVQGSGVLIIGASGTGKSALSLRMMALGAQLVADDRVDLRLQDDRVMAGAVAPISGLIEARGLGLLRAEALSPVPLAYIVDLDQPESARLPEPANLRVLRQTVPLLRGGGLPNLAAGLIQLVKMGRVDPEWPNT